MAKTQKDVVKEIIKNVGGPSNIISLTHCVSRLRFVLKDETKANKKALTELDEVMTVVQAGGQYQVVVGEKLVTPLYELAASQLNRTDSIDDPKNSSKSPTGIVSKLMDSISGVLSPILMLLAAAGLVKGLLSFFSSLGWLSTTSGFYMVLYALGDGFFYYFPIILGITAARKFKVNEFVGAAIGGALTYPTMVNLSSTAKVLGTILKGTPFEMSYYTTIFGIPVIMPGSGYTSSVIPIILAVLFAAFLDKQLRRLLPDVLKNIVAPFVTIVVTVILTYLVIGPVATLISNGLAWLVEVLYGIPYIGGAIAGIVLGGGFGILVMLGLHWAVLAIAISNIAVNGYDYIAVVTAVGPFVGMAQGLAICIKTRSLKVRNLALPATISQICAVGEPLMYSILLPLKKEYAINIICGAIGGMLLGISGAKAYLMGGQGLFGLANYINQKTGNMTDLYKVLICLGIAMIITFLVEFFLYTDKRAEEALALAK